MVYNNGYNGAVCSGPGCMHQDYGTRSYPAEVWRYGNKVKILKEVYVIAPSDGQLDLQNFSAAVGDEIVLYTDKFPDTLPKYRKASSN